MLIVKFSYALVLPSFHPPTHSLSAPPKRKGSSRREEEEVVARKKMVAVTFL